MAESSSVEQKNVTSGDKEVKASSSVWIVPLPWFSHMLCHLNLAKKLAEHGLTVTFCAPDDGIKNLVDTEHITPEIWEREGLDIRLQPLILPAVNLGHGRGHTSTLVDVLRAWTDTENAFEELLNTTIKSAPHSAPSCVISDFWLPVTRNVAAQHNIPTCVLSTSSPIFTVSSYYLHRLMSRGMLTLPGIHGTGIPDPIFQNEVISLPGLAVCPLKDIPHGNFTESLYFEYSRQSTVSLEKADVVLLPGFEELDGRIVRQLDKILHGESTRNNRKVPHVWTIGPLFPLSSHNNEAGEDGKEHPALKFLDSQPQSSVLYVAFGSDGNHSREQILEIAHGLENSQQPFLCVLHPPLKTAECQIDDIFSVIPADCIERTKGRGLFVQRWAPQLKVLSHPSTGGFLSHCGFNSLLESVCVGVPLLGWPLSAEQKLTTRWVVDEAKVGLEVCRGPGGFVDRREVERGVKALFHSDKGRAVRKKALELKEQAKESVGENGSSTKHMRALAALIRGP